LIIDGLIICASKAKGAVHDFEIFKQRGIHMPDDIPLLAINDFKVFAPFTLAI
jgi:hypothetical protein